MTLRLSMTALLLLLAGCSPGLGDFCHSNDDCKPGLRCSATGGQRGVCTYPEGVPDLVGPADLPRDQRLPDLDATPDALPDTSTDLPQSDLAAPDLQLPDQQIPDLAQPDVGQPDLAQPDAGQPDTSPADGAAAD